MLRIAVLMGGESSERDISRVSGEAVAKALAARGHHITLLDTERGVLPLTRGDHARIGSRPPEIVDEKALVAGPAEVSRLAGSLADVDAVFIALHGGWGEDGTVQAFFELAHIPYTGSGVLGSALAMDKHRAKQVMRAAGIDTPDWEYLIVDETAAWRTRLDEIRDRLGPDLIVKPNREGSTVGLSRVREADDLPAAIELASRHGPGVLVEPFVPGRELTVAVLGREALPVVEIVAEGGLYSYEAKYTKGKSRYEVPAALPDELAERMRRAGFHAFEALGCEGFARADFRLPPDGRFQCLEVNTIPGMTPLSLVPMAAKAAGISFEELVDRIVRLGRERGSKRRSVETGP